MSELSGSNPRNQLRTIAAGAALGVLIGIPSSSVEATNNHDALDDAAAIALRVQCDVHNIVDHGNNGEVTRSGSPRSDVTASIALTTVPDAQPALNRYQNDDTVIWYEPAVSGILQADQATGQFAYGQVLYDRYLAEPQSDDSRPQTARYEVTFSPIADYPDGTTIDLVLRNQVSYLGEAENQINMTGVVACGTMVSENGQWSLSGPSDLPPYIDTEIVPYQ